MRSTGVFRSLSWFRSWKSSVEVSRMVLRVWTMVEANVRSSSRSKMSAIEWKMLSACSRRQSCLGGGRGGRCSPCAAGGRAFWTCGRTPGSWASGGPRGPLTVELGPWLPGTPESHRLCLSRHPRPECEIPRKTAWGIRRGLSGKESPFYKRENWEPREQRKKAVSPGSLDQGDVNSDTRSQGQGSGKPIDLPGLPAAHRSLALWGQAGLSVGSRGISRLLEVRRANPGVGKGW